VGDGSVTAAVFGEAAWSCLLAKNNKRKVTINRWQLQQQKGEVALMALLCCPVAAQVCDVNSITTMQRDSLLDANQVSWCWSSHFWRNGIGK